MSRLRSTVEGHRLGVGESGGLRDKLSNAQLLQQYQDLLRENAQLKNIGNRLGAELKKLHTVFGTIPRPENVELYNAISSHPILHAIESTLTPLLETYELQCQNVENAFENINDLFVHLEKKFRQSQESNAALRAKFTDALSELVSMYQGGSSQHFGSDFTQIMMEQVNEKQRLLNEQNIRLERQYQRYKSEAGKNSKQLIQIKDHLRESKSQANISKQRVQKLQSQKKYLNDELTRLQDKISERDAQNKKLKWNLERTESEIHKLSTIYTGQQKNIKVLLAQIQNKQKTENRNTMNLKDESKFHPLQALEENSEIHNKLLRYQREIQTINKEKNKLNMQKESLYAKNNDLEKKCSELKKLLEKVEDDKRQLEREDAKNKKLLQKHIQKSKDDLERARSEYEDEKAKIKEDYFNELEGKRKEMKKLQERLQQITLMKNNLQQQIQLYKHQDHDEQKGGKIKNVQEKLSAKLTQKLQLAEELYKQELQITKNDYKFLTDELAKVKKQLKQKNQQLRCARQQINDLSGVREENKLIRQKVAKIKNQYSESLSLKERQFEQKIGQIKNAIQESQMRRRKDKENVEAACKEFRRINLEYKKTYEQRIRMLENKKNDN